MTRISEEITAVRPMIQRTDVAVQNMHIQSTTLLPVSSSFSLLIFLSDAAMFALLHDVHGIITSNPVMSMPGSTETREHSILVVRF